MGGHIFGMVGVLVNWWAYTWGGAYIREGAYIRRFTVWLDFKQHFLFDIPPQTSLFLHYCQVYIVKILYKFILGLRKISKAKKSYNTEMLKPHYSKQCNMATWLNFKQHFLIG